MTILFTESPRVPDKSHRISKVEPDNRHIISMKLKGYVQTPQDIMEEYNGCSVPQYTRYPCIQLDARKSLVAAANSSLLVLPCIILRIFFALGKPLVKDTACPRIDFNSSPVVSLANSM